MNRRLAAAVCAVGTAGSLSFAATAGAVSTESAYYFAGTHRPGQSSEVPETEWRFMLPPSWSHPVHTVQYPRDFAPFVGTMTVNASVDQGVENAMTEFDADYRDGDHVTLVGVSQGAIVAHLVTKEAVDEFGPETIYEVLTYGDPTNSDGGLLTKTPRFLLRLLGMPSVDPADYPMARLDNTVAVKYDIIADAPDVPPWRNPVAWLNAVAGGVYYHDTYTYGQLENARIDGAVVRTTTYYDDAGDVVPAEDATRVATRFLIDPTKSANTGMPLTQPCRDIGLLLHNDKGDVRVNTFWDRVDNALVKPIVEAGYDHGPNPEVDLREVSTTNGVPDEPVWQPAAESTPNAGIGDSVKPTRTERMPRKRSAITDASAEARAERRQHREQHRERLRSTPKAESPTVRGRGGTSH